MDTPGQRPSGPSRLRRGSLRAVLALATVGVGFLLRSLLDPWLGNTQAFALFYAVVACVAWWGGWEAAVLATIGGWLVGDWFFLPPRQSLAVTSIAQATELVTYFVVAGVIVYAIHSLRHAQRFAQYEKEQLEREVRQRGEIEASLRESEERFRSLAENMHQVVWLTSADLSRVLFVNSSYQRVWGRPAEAIYRDPMQWLASIHPDDRELVHQLFQSGAANNRFDVEYRIRRPDGTERWIRDQAFPVRGEGSRLICIAGLAEDITERKQAQEALARSHEELERQVAERTAQLREMLTELEHMSYSMVHDMRAPLRAIRSFTEIIESQDGTHLSPASRDYLGRMKQATQRMDSLVTDALNYGNAVRGALPLSPVQPKELLEGILNTNPALQSPQADVRLEGDFPAVMANTGGLTQCFSELLGNAVKFVLPGTEPRVRIHAEKERLLVKAPESGLAEKQQLQRRVRVWVEDNGIGIPAAAQPQIFAMFQRATDAYEGTGIGLAIVRKVAERMGGRVGVQSQPGKGSRFWVELAAA